MFNWWFHFFFVAALGRINNCMQARIPLSQHSFILGRYHHPMFVWKCFCQQVIFCVSKTALVLSTCTQIFPYSEGKYFFFSFFLNLHCLSFLIHVRSLTEVTTTQWGVRRVVLQGIPERVILLMGSWMRSRSLRPAHLFALGPARTAAAPDTAQVYEKFSTRGTREESHRLGCTVL